MWAKSGKNFSLLQQYKGKRVKCPPTQKLLAATPRGNVGNLDRFQGRPRAGETVFSAIKSTAPARAPAAARPCLAPRPFGLRGGSLTVSLSLVTPRVSGASGGKSLFSPPPFLFHPFLLSLAHATALIVKVILVAFARSPLGSPRVF